MAHALGGNETPTKNTFPFSSVTSNTSNFSVLILSGKLVNPEVSGVVKQYNKGKKSSFHNFISQRHHKTLYVGYCCLEKGIH